MKVFTRTRHARSMYGPFQLAACRAPLPCGNVTIDFSWSGMVLRRTPLPAEIQPTRSRRKITSDLAMRITARAPAIHDQITGQPVSRSNRQTTLRSPCS